MRALTAPLSLHAASSPIETIVFFFAVATLAYFHVLSAIKHSQFLAPTAPSTLRPALALLRDNEWVGVNENNWFEREGVTALEIQQLMLSIEPKAARKLSDSLLQDSFENATGFFTHQFLAASGKSYSDICFQPVSEEPSCFVASPSDSNVITLSFTPGTTDDFVTALKRPGLQDGDMNFVLETPESQSLSDMKNGRWVAYAAYTMVSRFWDLAKKADSLDILLVLAGYILMHATFIKLFLASRSLGSNFWLMTGILFSSVLSFILALPIASYFSIPLEPVSLIEALPFLVCTVGFDKPLRLARSVFTHPHLFQPAVTTGKHRGEMKPAPELIMEALNTNGAGNAIVRDYALEIAALMIGAYSKVGGLTEFCALAALLLTVDAVSMATFYVAVLSVMIEVRRIKMFRTLSQSKDTPASLAASKLVNGELPRQRTSLAELVLGVKGSFLRQPQGVVAKNSGSEKDDKKAQDNKEESPVARMKLFLIVSFLTLHILNMVTTLNPAQPPFSTELAPGVSRKVDITSPAISSVLASLADVHSKAATETELLVRVAPPVHIRMVPLVSATASHPSHKSSPSGNTNHHEADSDDVLESFMSSWTRLVGDPVMSKWIVLVLGVSVALNGYLLKGIATGTGSARSVTPPQSVRFTTTPSVSSGPSQSKGRDLVAVSAVPSSATVDLAALKGAEEAKARAERETAKEHDRWPQAEQHLLIIPRYHLASTVRDLNSAHIPLLNRMLSLATAVHASARPSLKSASRLNTGFHIPPFSSVSHLHLHVLSGKPTWLGRLKHPFSSSPALKPDRDREHQQQPPQPADTFVTAPPAQENGSSLARNPASSEARVNGIPHDQDGLVAPRDDDATEKESKQRLGWGWYISGPQAIRILEHGGRIGLGPGGRRGIERISLRSQRRE